MRYSYTRLVWLSAKFLFTRRTHAHEVIFQHQHYDVIGSRHTFNYMEYGQRIALCAFGLQPKPFTSSVAVLKLGWMTRYDLATVGFTSRGSAN